MIPPTTQAFVRRVAPNINLWLWFMASEGHVTIITVVRAPPVPCDPSTA